MAEPLIFVFGSNKAGRHGKGAALRPSPHACPDCLATRSARSSCLSVSCHSAALGGLFAPAPGCSPAAF